MLSYTSKSLWGVMGRISNIILFAGLMSVQALAEEADGIIYLPAKDGMPPQTLNYQTGEAKTVIESFGGEKPQVCPDEAYWAPSTDKVVNCADGMVYKLQKAQESAGIPYGAMALVPAKDPKPGTTDEPGPSKSDPDGAAENKVAP